MALIFAVMVEQNIFAKTVADRVSVNTEKFEGNAKNVEKRERMPKIVNMNKKERSLQEIAHWVINKMHALLSERNAIVSKSRSHSFKFALET